jgi:hypothetical protein
VGKFFGRKGKIFGGKIFWREIFGGKIFGGKIFGGKNFGGKIFWQEREKFWQEIFGGKLFGGKIFMREKQKVPKFLTRSFSNANKVGCYSFLFSRAKRIFFLES